MRRLLLLLTINLSSCATGPDPSSYDHPFKGKTYIRYLSPADMASWCGRPAKGCMLVYDRGLPTATCMIYINSGYRTAAWIAKIKQHELRHCNGYTGEADY